MILDYEDLPLEKKSEIELIQKCILLGSSSNEALCAQIVAYKALKMNKKIALICMAELSFRRSLGDDFPYETFISEKVKSIPKIPNVDLNQVRGIMNVQALVNMVKK